MGRIKEEIKTVVSPSETVSLILKQSVLHSIAPSALVVTDRRIILIHHSFWGLYTKFNLMSPTEMNIAEHKNLKSVALGRGKMFGTIRLRLLGFVDPSQSLKYEWDLEGLWVKDALEATNVLGRVSEGRSEAQDAKMSPENIIEAKEDAAEKARLEEEIQRKTVKSS
jgi:hypothetical protein